MTVILPPLRYDVLASGPPDGPRPGAADDVVLNLTVKTAAGALIFQSSEGGFTAKAGGLVPGGSGAVKLMRPGDRWLLSVPSWLAYGGQGYGPVPADADLVVDMELVSITPSV